jgi:hypothetical protein
MDNEKTIIDLNQLKSQSSPLTNDEEDENDISPFEQEIVEEGLSSTEMINFGHTIKAILSGMLAGTRVNASVRGDKPDIEAFMKTLTGEKNYLQSYKKYGLDDQKTQFSRASLDSAIRAFERKTGIKWPIK